MSSIKKKFAMGPWAFASHLLLTMVAVIICAFLPDQTASARGSDDYMTRLEIDCHGRENADTQNNIIVTFYDGDEPLWTFNQKPICGSLKDWHLEFPKWKPTHFVMEATGGDAFWIDEAQLYWPSSSRIGHFGREGGGGYCLSTQNEKLGDSQCYRAIRFSVEKNGSGKVFPSKPIPHQHKNVKKEWHSPRRDSYPRPVITNNTWYKIQGTIHWFGMNANACPPVPYSVDPKSQWEAPFRYDCLITKITGDIPKNSKPRTQPLPGRSESGLGAKQGPVRDYSSSGTSYSQFRIESVGGNKSNSHSAAYRVFSENEYSSYREGQQVAGKSPGFRIRNATSFPLRISLDQYSCLYHDIVEPGDYFVRNTGAVWFTISATLAVDGEQTTAWNCAEPVAKLTAAVLSAAIAGGPSAYAMYSGSTAPVASALLNLTTAKHFIKISQKIIDQSVAIADEKDPGRRGQGPVSEALRTLSGLPNDTQQTLEKMGKSLMHAARVSLGGQYAGPEWPLRCDKMPEFEVVGGQPYLRKSGADVVVEATALRIVRLSDCGSSLSAKSHARPKKLPDTVYFDDSGVAMKKSEGFLQSPNQNLCVENTKTPYPNSPAIFVESSTCKPSDPQHSSQHWTYDPSSKRIRQIRGRYAACISIWPHRSEDTTHPAKVSKCEGDNGPHDWQSVHYDHSSGEIRSLAINGQCLDTWGGRGRVRWYSCHGQGGNQKFRFVKSVR